MGHAAHAEHDNHSSSHQGAHHSPSYYVKIWALLLFLLVVSILGPMLENKILTLITAFGIAVVKAAIVCAYFMHLNVEKKYIWYMLVAMLLMVGVFFAGTAVDINRPDGRNWINNGAHKQMEEHSTPATGEGHDAPQH
jgi:caa(3)-type oxidase subunit IV